MASVIRQKNGRKMIQFTDAGGKRATIRLGKLSQRQADAIKIKVENLVAAKLSGHAVDDETARWVAKLDPVIADRLANSGLIAKRKFPELQPFISNYISSREDVKPATLRAWRQALHHLTRFFGSACSLRNITSGDAAAWRQSLVNRGLADATVRKHTGYAKQFFSVAVDYELIASNPFRKLVSGPVGNKSRQYFVTCDEAEKVLASCPNAEWRLLFALSRYGGLRCPSEHLSLRWEDIDWGQGRIHVRSPKTERHEGHEARVIPLFPELRPYLDDVFELAEPGSDFVITRYRNSAGNLRTQFTRIVKRAGLVPWPRITHNLRASRETELCEQFPVHVVAAWLGNSVDVASKHYLQVTDQHFEKALQNALQQSTVLHRIRPQGVLSRESPDVAERAETGCVQDDATQNERVRRAGDNVALAVTGVDGNRTHLAPFQRPHWV